MMSQTSWGRRKYRTTNWKAYNAALKAQGDLTIWLDKSMQWLAPPSGKPGAIQTKPRKNPKKQPKLLVDFHPEVTH